MRNLINWFIKKYVKNQKKKGEFRVECEKQNLHRQMVGDRVNLSTTLDPGSSNTK